MTDHTPMEGEVWRPIHGWEGLYEVSSEGRVRSLPRVDALGRPIGGHVLSPWSQAPGYRALRLSVDGAQRKYFIHTLVAEAFIEPRPSGLEVCHNDGDPSNNHVANLRWDTHSNNLRDTVLHGRNRQALRTECVNGHAFDEVNTALRAGGRGRDCRTCQRARQAAYRSRRAAS